MLAKLIQQELGIRLSRWSISRLLRHWACRHSVPCSGPECSALHRVSQASSP
ncbi:hypothetical protein [Thiohalobacter sp. IOR34]|uniref:hypothetical protein n=1 Tax=Thiohalobacter sp. IOR34 TaxID=3057176 RepID=UPI00339D85DE